MTQETKDQGRCPKFNPAPWDDKLFHWDGKPFLKNKWYTTCPKCAKKYGKSDVAVIGEVEAKERA